jgi:hypothetical protein
MEDMTDAQVAQMMQLMNFADNPLFWIMMITSLVGLILYVIVLIKIFRYGGIAKGILGIICSIYTFIWGWLNAKQYELTPLMLLWSFLIILSLIQYFLFQAVMMQRLTAVMDVMGTNGY